MHGTAQNTKSAEKKTMESSDCGGWLEISVDLSEDSCSVPQREAPVSPRTIVARVVTISKTMRVPREDTHSSEDGEDSEYDGKNKHRPHRHHHRRRRHRDVDADGASLECLSAQTSPRAGRIEKSRHLERDEASFWRKRREKVKSATQAKLSQHTSPRSPRAHNVAPASGDA